MSDTNVELEAGPAPKDTSRKPSLKEQPSYLKEVSTALNRREDLIKMKERLSTGSIRGLDPATKPWMRRSASVTSSPDIQPIIEGSKDKERSRNLSHDTQASDNTDNSFLEDE